MITTSKKKKNTIPDNTQIIFISNRRAVRIIQTNRAREQQTWRQIVITSNFCSSKNNIFIKLYAHGSEVSSKTISLEMNSGSDVLQSGSNHRAAKFPSINGDRKIIKNAGTNCGISSSSSTTASMEYRTSYDKDLTQAHAYKLS